MYRLTLFGVWYVVVGRPACRIACELQEVLPFVETGQVVLTAGAPLRAPRAQQVISIDMFALLLGLIFIF